MGISEAVIIYLAIGAPLGVYAIIRSKSSLKANLAGLLAANVLFWPILASRELAPRSENRQGLKYFVYGRSGSADGLEDRKAVVNALDQIADRRVRRSALDGFERFAALSQALNTDMDPSFPVPEIFVVTGHVNPRLAAKCLSRRNSGKLKDHYQRAAKDLRSVAHEFPFEDRAVFEAALAKADVNIHDSSVSRSTA